MKLILIALVSVTVLGLGVAANFDGLTHAAVTDKQETSPIGRRPPGLAVRPEQTEPAEHIPYMFLFQYLSAIKHDSGFVNNVRTRSGLSKNEFDELVRVAVRYRSEVDSFDRRAQEIVAEFRRQYPPGRLPAGTGPGRPPQELIELQSQRNGAALRYRDEARSLIDPEKLEVFVQSEIRPRMTRTTKEEK